MASLDISQPVPELSASFCFAGVRGNNRLIMVFLGWGMSPEPFLHLAKPGYDVLLLWGYHRGDVEEFPTSLRSIVGVYSEIVVIAWSFGVVAASYIMERLGDMPVTRKVAVNGTPRHIDRRMGIPPAVFSLTLKGLTSAAVDKFNDRMFADRSERAAFIAAGQSRSFDSVLEELRFFGSLPPYTGSFRWNFAVEGGKDLIFSPAGQETFWKSVGVPITIMPEAGHFIDLRSVINDFVVDKELVASRFGSAMGTYRESAGTQRAVASRLWTLVKPFVPVGALRVLEVGVGDGLLTELYAGEINRTDLLLMDIAMVDKERLPAKARFECCDAEEAVGKLAEESVDLILSASTLQWFHSPERFVEMAYRALSPGGVMALAFFGEGTYREVASLTGVSLKYPDPSCWNMVGEVLVSEKETVTEIFADSVAAVRHISRTGVNALRRDSATSVREGRRLLRGLHASPDGRVKLTYVPNYLIIRKPI